MTSSHAVAFVEGLAGYRVLPSFTEFYRVLPSFTEYYRVLPSFTSRDGGAPARRKNERERERERERV